MPVGCRSSGSSASSATLTSTTSPSTMTSHCWSWNSRPSTAAPCGPSACRKPHTPSPPARPSGSPAGATPRREVSWLGWPRVGCPPASGSGRLSQGEVETRLWVRGLEVPLNYLSDLGSCLNSEPVSSPVKMKIKHLPRWCSVNVRALWWESCVL